MGTQFLSKNGQMMRHIFWLRFTVKPALRGHTKRTPKLVFFKTDYLLMQVKSIAECYKGSILQYFLPSLTYNVPFVIKIFVLSIFEWLLKTGFTVTKWVFNYTLIRNSA